MVLEDRLKMVIGDLAFQLTISQQKIEELEKQLAEEKSRTGNPTSGTPTPS